MPDDVDQFLDWFLVLVLTLPIVYAIGYGLRNLVGRREIHAELTMGEPENEVAEVSAVNFVKTSDGRRLDIRNDGPKPARNVHVFLDHRRVTDFRGGTSAPEHPIAELAPGEKRSFYIATGPAPEASRALVRLKWTDDSGDRVHESVVEGP